MEETIAAVSTPYGTGGIGIIRISGGMAFHVAGKLFKGKKPFGSIKSHTVNYGKIIDPSDGRTIDEVLLTKMEKPHTFTREDVVEINCHGGITVLRKMLELVFAEGVRPAEPGEFTKRAFLNGRIDLSQAEAVIDLINSKTAEGSRAAVDQLEGRLSGSIKAARRELVGLIAHIEATVDYPEHDIEEITGRQVYEKVKALRTDIEKIAGGFDKGRILREGIRAVIAGKPNVGKSSLLNELSGGSRAIVTDIPGTTRDIIEEYINIRGIPVRLSDTAGIRHTDDPVESIGVKKAEDLLELADLVIMVLDASTGMEPEDFSILRRLEGKKAIYFINKTDLADEDSIASIRRSLPGGTSLGVPGDVSVDVTGGSSFSEPGGTSLSVPSRTTPGVIVIEASILKGTGIDRFEEAVESMFVKGGIDFNSEVLVTNARHKNLLDRAKASLDAACEAYEGKMPLDFITIDIRDAASYLGMITGESVSEDVITEIFSRFCVGK